MKASRFTASQILATLEHTDAGVPVNDSCH